MAAGKITRWYRVKWFAPVPLLPEQGLATKIFMDRVMELWPDTGWEISDDCSRIYGIIPLITAIEGAVRML